jgi:Domain of unknown function (DUF5666)
MTTRIPIGAIRLLAGATVALAAAGTLVACSKTSGSGAAAAANTPAPASSGSSSPSSSASRAARGIRPAALGTIAALAAASMEVQNPQSGQVTVTFGSKTAFTETKATTKASVVVGTCVAAMAARSASSGSAAPSSSAPSASPRPRVTSFTAATVVITQPVNGTCNGGFGGGPNGSGALGPGGPPSGAFPSGAPSGGFGRGGFGNFARANGKVTAVAASTMTVVGTTRTGSITYTVTVDPSTVYTATGSGTAASLAVGKCVIAFGSTGSTGDVSATRIAVSPASASGCTTAGFGRGRFGGASSSTGG